MPYPTAKVHRPSRRHLGRGQYPTSASVGVTVTGNASNATMVFSRPVVVTGPIPLSVAGLTLVSQNVSNGTTVIQTMSGAVATHAYNLPGGAANVSTYQGGQVAGTAGTF